MPEPEMFQCALGDYVRALEPTTEADPSGVLATLVSATGVMLGSGPALRIGDSRHPLTVWTLLCGRTAAGRKGTAEAVARRVLVEADPVFWKDNIVSGLSSAEGLIAALADDEEVASGSTVDKRRLVVEPEFGVVLARAKREGNALAQVMREAWDGRDLRVQTKIPLVASAPHIAVTGHISPEEFRGRVSQRDLAGGSYNRFLLVYVERSKRLPEGGGAADDLVREMGLDLRARLEKGSRRRMVRRADAAAAHWHALYDELVDLEDDPLLADWVARAIPYTMRVAGLYAVLDGTEQITSRHLDAASALVRYSMQSVRFVFKDGKAAAPRNDAAWVAQAIGRAGLEGVSRAQLTKLFASRGDASALERAVQQVLAMPGYTLVEIDTGGRPARRYIYAQPRPEANIVPSSFRPLRAVSDGGVA
jgi:Protein of unknown function (DUF3987)